MRKDKILNESIGQVDSPFRCDSPRLSSRHETLSKCSAAWEIKGRRRGDGVGGEWMTWKWINSWCCITIDWSIHLRIWWGGKCLMIDNNFVKGISVDRQRPVLTACWCSNSSSSNESCHHKMPGNEAVGREKEVRLESDVFPIQLSTKSTLRRLQICYVSSKRRRERGREGEMHIQQILNLSLLCLCLHDAGNIHRIPPASSLSQLFTSLSIQHQHHPHPRHPQHIPFLWSFPFYSFR